MVRAVKTSFVISHKEYLVHSTVLIYRSTWEWTPLQATITKWIEDIFKDLELEKQNRQFWFFFSVAVDKSCDVCDTA